MLVGAVHFRQEDRQVPYRQDGLTDQLQLRPWFSHTPGKGIYPEIRCHIIPLSDIPGRGISNWSDDPSGGSTSVADRLHPAHPDAAPFVAVEPEADGVHAPAVDAMTVEVVEEIEGPVTAGGVGAIEAVPRLPAPAAAHRQPRGFVLHALQGTAARRRSGASTGCSAIRVTRPDRLARCRRRSFRPAVQRR